MTEPIRVLLVDDQPLIRLGFAMVLDAEPDIAIVGEAGDGQDALAQSVRLQPDVVLMDVRMPRVDGIAATADILAALPDTRVLVLTTFDLDEYAFAALDAGASGFLLKDVDRHALVAAVRAVAGGDAVLSPRVTREVIARRTARAAPDATAREELARIATLTPREADVFRALARGLGNAEIAAELYLGETTVKTHVGRVLAKLGARDRIQAVIIAHRCGWGDDRPASEATHRGAR
ncbi:response regulator [Microbacterium dextranolyticum]|uniref:DNA-binding response regulator n=1 Tax=Microbacterium dextranolyticum TaxID=36806 RepID=A0A9W6M641_9MICO|nr:response regulator transcription factor [Microbacterium dextranolyticum]MBM7462836.1 DNA-binding NarL/FixJ family response regulator [Microbacterium dextranolyticum]GLJ96059.1 DNA-binding response regulator [Microbacterium dextranolyticum]